MMRRGRCRGRPRGRGTLTWASVASANGASCGDADARRTPKGIPWPSTRSIHFVPLPRLVFPTAKPPFLQEQNFHPKKSLPTAKGLVGRDPTAERATLLPTHPAPPIAANDASRWIRWDTARADPAIGLRCAAPIKHPRNKLGCWPTAAHDHRDAASVSEKAVPTSSTAAR